LVKPYPVSVEVMTNDKQGMIDQAMEFSSWADNINIKITIHGPNGELDNLEVVRELEYEHDVRVNTTAMMSAQQCFLAALAGATYVSLFGGRVNNMGYNSCGEISKIRDLVDRFGLKSKIIIGSTREALNIIEWLHSGADIVTVTPNLIEKMIVHPYSKETVQMFLRDAESIKSILKS
jgi:transaldolase